MCVCMPLEKAASITLQLTIPPNSTTKTPKLLQANLHYLLLKLQDFQCQIHTHEKKITLSLLFVYFKKGLVQKSEFSPAYFTADKCYMVLIMNIYTVHNIYSCLCCKT